MTQEFKSQVTVTEQNCALAMGSGDMNVFATPAMVALMENAAMKLAATLIDRESATVGTHIAANHTKASPLGETITAVATLDSQNGRELKFTISACDSKGEIGTASHTRFIVNRAKFLGKL